MKKTGRILLSADLAREYGFTDDNGLITGDMREVRSALAIKGWTTLAAFIPRFIRVPHIIIYMIRYTGWAAKDENGNLSFPALLALTGKK